MIEAAGLTRRYGEFAAVDDVSFTAADREIVGLLGPNGAGKTTTLRMVTGFLAPTAGRVRLAGHDVQTAPTQARRRLGYLPEAVALYPEMRVGEYLRFRARLHGLRGAAATRAIDRAIQDCLLESVSRQIVGTLSKGYRQRVGLAAAILHEPQVLVLDEPTVGLDPRQILAIRELIRRLGRERTVLLSTHHMPEVEALCDRVLILDGGRIVAEGTPAALRSAARGRVELTVTFGTDRGPLEGEALAAARLALAQLAGVDGVEPRNEPGRFTLACAVPDSAPDSVPDSAPGTPNHPSNAALGRAPDDPRAAVFRLAVERGWLLLESAERTISLEDAFVRLIDGEPTANPSSGPDPSVPDPSVSDRSSEIDRPEPALSESRSESTP